MPEDGPREPRRVQINVETDQELNGGAEPIIEVETQPGSGLGRGLGFWTAVVLGGVMLATAVLWATGFLVAVTASVGQPGGFPWLMGAVVLLGVAAAALLYFGLTGRRVE